MLSYDIFKCDKNLEPSNSTLVLCALNVEPSTPWGTLLLHRYCYVPIGISYLLGGFEFLVGTP